MKLGVMADVHGNRIALEAVVADARSLGVDAWWVLGDLVAIGPEPVATLELIADLPNVTITRGNTERYVLTTDRPLPHRADALESVETLDLLIAVESSFSWTRGTLAATGWLPWLDGLPLEVRITLPDGTSMFGVHATPGLDDGPGITPHRDAGELAAALSVAGADIVVGGHTHQPTDRVVAGIRALNPGSVGNPIVDDRRAAYVVVHADADRHHIEHRRVAYDREAFLERLAESGHPQQDYIASFQRGDQIRYPAEREGAPALTM